MKKVLGLKPFLQGKKTYIVALIAFLVAANPIVFEWVNGNLDWLDTTNQLWNVAILPLLATTLRAGINK